jgi:hypothetical protein
MVGNNALNWVDYLGRELVPNRTIVPSSNGVCINCHPSPEENNIPFPEPEVPASPPQAPPAARPNNEDVDDTVAVIGPVKTLLGQCLYTCWLDDTTDEYCLYGNCLLSDSSSAYSFCEKRLDDDSPQLVDLGLPEEDCEECENPISVTFNVYQNLYENELPGKDPDGSTFEVYDVY